MIKTIRITSQIHPLIFQQVSAMGAEYTQDLSISGVGPSSPLFGIYQGILVTELGTYMASIGRQGVPQGELIIATDDEAPNQVLGFLLYMPLNGTTDSCGVNYTAVRRSHRGTGIMRKMFDEMLARYPNVSLSCQIDLVPLYEHMGFKVEGNHEVQISMIIGKKSDAQMPVFNPDDVIDHPVIQTSRSLMLQKYGAGEIHKAMLHHDSSTQARIKKAQDFAEQRMAMYTH